MGFRTTFIFILFWVSVLPALARATALVDEILVESSPIVTAIDHDDASTVKNWLNAGHSPLAKIKNKLHEPLIERAATHSSIHAFAELLSIAHFLNEDANLKDNRGTPLLLTLSELAVPGKASNAVYEQMIELMLSVSPEIAQAKDRAYIGDGRTALHEAAAIGNLHVVEMLIARGAPVNAKNASGECPLHLAARFGHLEIVKFLLAKGAQINIKSKFTRSTPLMAAAEMGHESIIHLLMMSGAERDSRDTFGKTAPERFREYRIAYASSTPRKIQN
jgi:ankyrin repeat protein